jgi:hypothetical protein
MQSTALLHDTMPAATPVGVRHASATHQNGGAEGHIPPSFRAGACVKATSLAHFCSKLSTQQLVNAVRLSMRRLRVPARPYTALIAIISHGARVRQAAGGAPHK